MESANGQIATWSLSASDPLSEPVRPVDADDPGGSRVDDRLYAVPEVARSDHAPDAVHVQVPVVHVQVPV